MFRLTNLFRHFYLNFTPLQTHALFLNKILRGPQAKKFNNYFYANKYFRNFKLHFYKRLNIFSIRNKVIENLLIKLIMKYVSRRIFLIHN